jgi:hypothetical protein
MQLALSSLRFQNIHDILLPTLGNFIILANFSLSLLEKHVRPLLEKHEFSMAWVMAAYE